MERPRCGSPELEEIDAPESFVNAIPYPFKEEIKEIWSGLRHRLKLEACPKCGYLGIVARDPFDTNP